MGESPESLPMTQTPGHHEANSTQTGQQGAWFFRWAWDGLESGFRPLGTWVAEALALLIPGLIPGLESPGPGAGLAPAAAPGSKK